MPARWIVTLNGPAEPDIPLNAPHAVISRWLDENHKAPVKGYAISPPRSRGPITVLEIRLLDDALADRLTAGAAVGERVRLGRHRFTVATPPHLDIAQPWQDLSSTTGVRAWEVRFLSPTTFRRGSRTSPMPAPDSVLTSLKSRWRLLHPATAPALDRSGEQSLWVSDLQGHSQALSLRDTVVSGFVGRGEPTLARVASPRLLRSCWDDVLAGDREDGVLVPLGRPPPRDADARLSELATTDLADEATTPRGSARFRSDHHLAQGDVSPNASANGSVTRS